MSSARGSHMNDIENEKFRSSWYHIGSDRSIIANLNVVRIIDDGKKLTDREWHNYFKLHTIWFRCKERDSDAWSDPNTGVSLDVREWYDVSSKKSYNSKVIRTCKESIGVSRLRLCQNWCYYERRTIVNRFSTSWNSRFSRNAQWWSK